MSLIEEKMTVAIQGELGSNSHMAALAIDDQAEIVPCASSAEVFESLLDGSARMAVLPIENSLHGSVFEHYDLLLEHQVAIVGETLLRIRHNVIAAPGVALTEIRRILSHPVALSQCRRWLRAHPAIEVLPAYDTAGSVKQLMQAGSRDTAGIAPELAAHQYHAHVLVPGIEDHPENYTRFYSLKPRGSEPPQQDADKMSLAFTLEHRPGTLLGALEEFRRGGLNLTKIESRPVPGRPWEYVFFVDVTFDSPAQADEVVAALTIRCQRVEVLGRYRAAPLSSARPS